jgi:hypothetical protein
MAGGLETRGWHHRSYRSADGQISGFTLKGQAKTSPKVSKARTQGRYSDANNPDSDQS